MKALLTIATAGLLLAGCSTAGPPVPASDTPASAAPSASGPSPKDGVLAALRKTHAAPYTFTVSGQMPDKQRIKASGSVDAKTRKLSNSTKITGGKDPSSNKQIVIGNALYSNSGGGGWVHLDMKRAKYDHLKVDMKDPVGLAAFTSSVQSASSPRTGVYQGSFKPSAPGVKDFLPIGSPAISVIGGSGKYVVTTDAKGWVTKIDIDLRADENIKMTTTLSAHGKALPIKKPRNAGEADDLYYK
jgi:hypothetical protein